MPKFYGIKQKATTEHHLVVYIVFPLYSFYFYLSSGR
jgi:hypothetical protein